MARFTNEQVVEAFLNQRPANAGALTTDGQSLFSYNLRIAEHIQQNGGACTLVETAKASELIPSNQR